MTPKKSPTQAEPRLIRVFVSSTFRDMQAERDELAKFIFPQLRKLCEQRGVAWGFVDLRWGISSEQKAEGQVLPICLDEIHRCRPYFIGALGERYGSLPDEISPELIKSEPWLKEHVDHSVTELEILHGVLNNPEMAQHAFFYLRDPKYVGALPAKERPAFLESGSSEDIKKYGRDDAQRRAKQKLEELKQRVRSSSFPVHDNYQNPKEFGQYVLKDLTEIIDHLYPEGSQPDPLDRQAAEHEAFAASRAKVYIGRKAYAERLDAYVKQGGPPLVVLGESGSGKSALLANWALNYRKEHPKDLVLMHFIGPGSADWAAMLRRILGEFRRKFDFREEIPDQLDALRSAFANWLNMVAARGRVVVILDALNQLDDRDGAPDLVWLPPHIPENVRMFLSTLPGRALDELKKRGHAVLTVEPLQYEECKQLILEYLALSRKALDKAPTELIANAQQCQNPLFLRVLLDELQLFGSYEGLVPQIKHYLKARTVAGLYELTLKRFEQDYERDRPGLVHDAMSLLWAARRGLSEVELKELLGANGQSLPHAYWAPLYLAIEQSSLLSRSGLIDFAHDYLRQAVHSRYLTKEPDQNQAHERLADYFEAQSGQSLRRLDELPWQLAQAGNWQRLYALLGNLAFSDAAWQCNRFEVKAYWAQVEANSPNRMLDAYRKVIDHPTQHPDHVWFVSTLLGDAGHAEEALTLFTYLVGHYRKTGDKDVLGRSLGNQALILKNRGDLDGAMALHKEGEHIFRELGDMDGLQASLGNQASILYARGDLDGAMALNKEQERICREVGQKTGLSSSLASQATILYTRGDLEEAMALNKEQERMCRELGDKDGLELTFGNQAVILRARGDLDGAMALNKEQERICRELGNKSGLSRTFGSQANILYGRGDLDGAMALFKEQEHICRELGDMAWLLASVGNQANILHSRGDLGGAIEMHREEEGICRKLGDKEGLATSLGNQATILSDQGDLEGAMAMHKDEERVWRELGDKGGLAGSLANQASLLGHVRKTAEDAFALADEAYRLATESGYVALAKQIETIRAQIRDRLN